MTLDVGVGLADLVERGVDRRAEFGEFLRQRHLGLGRQPFDVGEVQPVARAPAFEYAKPPLAHGTYAEQPVRLLREIDDACQRADVVGHGRAACLLPFADQHDAESRNSSRMQRRTRSM